MPVKQITFQVNMFICDSVDSGVCGCTLGLGFPLTHIIICIICFSVTLLLYLYIYLRVVAV